MAVFVSFMGICFPLETRDDLCLVSRPVSYDAPRAKSR